MYEFSILEIRIQGLTLVLRDGIHETSTSKHLTNKNDKGTIFHEPHVASAAFHGVLLQLEHES